MKKTISLFLSLVFLFLCTACAALKPHEMNFFAMDTAASFQIFGDTAEETANDMQSQVFAIDAALDRHSETSAVSALNRGETLPANTAYLSDLLPLCLSICKATEGAFEPTMAAVSDAWQFTSENPTVPSETILQSLLQNVGLREHPVLTAEDSIALAEKVQLDFGAIAKGYTLDHLYETMKDHHCYGTLDLGGEICVVGKKPDGSLWRVGIKDPLQEGKLLGVIALHDCFIATSGAYERYFEQDGVRYHHILDPKTGKPTQSGLISVTVVSQSGAWSDALSTALFVLGENGAAKLQKNLAATHPFEYILVSENRHITVSRKLAKNFTLQNKDYSLETAK